MNKDIEALLDAWRETLIAIAKERDEWDRMIFGSLKSAEDWQEEFENMENGQ